MPGIRWLLIIVLGAILSSAPCLADDDGAMDRLSASLATLYAAAIIAEYDDQVFDRRSNSYDMFRRAHSYEQPLAALEFQRSDAIGRMTRVRSLSLMTIAETRSSRLFFGVNRDGLLGIHLLGSDDRHLEFARMPWLRRGAQALR